MYSRHFMELHTQPMNHAHTHDLVFASFYVQPKSVHSVSPKYANRKQCREELTTSRQSARACVRPQGENYADLQKNRSLFSCTIVNDIHYLIRLVQQSAYRSTYIFTLHADALSQIQISVCIFPAHHTPPPPPPPSPIYRLAHQTYRERIE